MTGSLSARDSEDQREIGDGVVVGQPGFQQQLDENRLKYLEDFVTRPEFVDESVALARVRRAEMVKAFIESEEYRVRFFGALGGNQEGKSEGGRRGTLEGNARACAESFLS